MPSQKNPFSALKTYRPIMNFVADTHALLWWFTDSPKLSLTASKIFEKCEAGENIIFIPLDSAILERMITLKEIPELHDKLIASTAKHLKVPVITKDTILRDLKSIKTVW